MALYKNLHCSNLDRLEFFVKPSQILIISSFTFRHLKCIFNSSDMKIAHRITEFICHFDFKARLFFFFFFLAEHYNVRFVLDRI